MIKHYNPMVEELENLINGVKPDLILESLQFKIQMKDIEIKELKQKIEQLQTNKNIMRLAALLEYEDVQEKFQAFLNINEKVRYYKKYEQTNNKNN